MPETLEGWQKAASKWESRHRKLAKHLIDSLEKNDNLKYELKRLEDVLAWIHRTEQPVEEIKTVVARTIPNKLKRETWDEVSE